MKITGMVHCLFEQSGVFKNAFLDIGIHAVDYDIQNHYGKTDCVCDLFREITAAYKGKKSLFDSILPEDLVIAFFPCTYFCSCNQMIFTGVAKNMRSMSVRQRTEYLLERSQQRQRFYELALKLFAVCEEKNIRLIVENPFSIEHYLYNNFPYSPALIDKNRQLRGDYYVKPTQYYYLNCCPTSGCSITIPAERRVIEKSAPSKLVGICSRERSEISAAYARNFIFDFIIGREQSNSVKTLF